MSGLKRKIIVGWCAYAGLLVLLILTGIRLWESSGSQIQIEFCVYGPRHLWIRYMALIGAVCVTCVCLLCALFPLVLMVAHVMAQRRVFMMSRKDEGSGGGGRVLS